VEAYAKKNNIAMEWAKKGVRKKQDLQPELVKTTRQVRFGVYFILKSMETGPSFRIAPPKFPTKDPNYRIVRPHSVEMVEGFVDAEVLPLPSLNCGCTAADGTGNPKAATGIFETVEGCKSRTGSMAVANHSYTQHLLPLMQSKILLDRSYLPSENAFAAFWHPACSISTPSRAPNGAFQTKFPL
jgi:hypothetical protein